MSGIDLLIDEHKYVKRMLVVIRKACLNFMDNKEINYDDFEKMIKFVREFADGHHHKKEEVFLFNQMVEHLGETGKNVITHGMLVEHDLGRSYMRNLEEALNKYKNGQIHEEDNVIFTFAKKSLKEDIIKDIDERCFEYEEKNSFTREENIGILNSLEEKYN